MPRRSRYKYHIVHRQITRHLKGYNVPKGNYNKPKPTFVPQYRYKLISTGDSSAKYGNCEVCGKYCTEVFSQVEERSYEPILPDEKSETCWTRHQCHDLFGHEECLISKRKEAYAKTVSTTKE